MLQIIGTNKCRSTQKAIRWCKERKIEFQYIDLNEKKLSKKEYETAYLWIKRKAESKTTHYSVSENFKIARKFLNSNSKIGKLNKPLSQEEESREFEQQNTFVCSTFICHVLYSSVNSIREYINDNLIDPDYTTPTDIISMPGIKQLFTSSWDNYNIAAQNFVKENELFNEWL